MFPGTKAVVHTTISMNLDRLLINNIRKLNLPILSGEVPLSRIKAVYREISKHKNNKLKDILVIEEYKLAILRAIQEKLPTVNIRVKENNAPQKKSLWYLIGITFLILIQLVPALIIGYTGTTELLTLLIPSIPQIFASFLGIILTTVDNLLEVIATVILIRSASKNVTLSKGDPLITLYENQINTAHDINQTLTNIACCEKMNRGEYIALTETAKCVNEETTNIFIKKYTEPKLKRGLRYFLTFITLATQVGGGIYMINFILFTSIAFTPVGWILTGLFGVSALLLRYFSRTDNLYEILNPSHKQNTDVSDKLAQFTSKKIHNEVAFDSILSIKDREIEYNKPKQPIEKKSTWDRNCIKKAILNIGIYRFRRFRDAILESKALTPVITPMSVKIS